jgi:hypothetical protein
MEGKEQRVVYGVHASLPTSIKFQSYVVGCRNAQVSGKRRVLFFSFAVSRSQTNKIRSLFIYLQLTTTVLPALHVGLFLFFSIPPLIALDRPACYALCAPAALLRCI